MAAEGHLRGDELFTKTNRASEFFLSSEDDKLDFSPFSSFVKLHITNLFVSSMRRVNYTTEFGSEV